MRVAPPGTSRQTVTTAKRSGRIKALPNGLGWERAASRQHSVACVHVARLCESTTSIFANPQNGQMKAGRLAAVGPMRIAAAVPVRRKGGWQRF